MAKAKVELDAHGFLREEAAWTPDSARTIASRHGIEALTARHFDVLHCMRRHYRQHCAIPPAQLVCHELDLDGDCIDALFGGPLIAWQIAGLPHPGEEVRVYLDNQTRADTDGA